ncbi:RPAP1-like C-terminal family protein [Babesia bovis T2Bo]|uniref:RPAP1-like C-terminal family protein n=1 Tax=Babesia bovis T2Bo TaxID=484906 RepID=UPI001C365890|nr:RPAP1-like C-terminal family protein [Babesia bovis T2Bo]EDO06261.2 RPAP1-like C-terminal family protein [Babesia bovis T2Bo]
MDNLDVSYDTASGYSDNDFDIVEHFSDDDAPSADFKPKAPRDPDGRVSGFPRALHRTMMPHQLGCVNLDKPKTDHVDHRSGHPKVSFDDVDYGIPDISTMSAEEINEHQAYIRERLGKDNCDFLIRRRLQRLGLTPDLPQSDGHTDAGTNRETLSKAESNKITCSSDIWFKSSNFEFQKLEWTNPVESVQDESSLDPSSLRLHELRFDFDGNLLDGHASDSHRHDTALYNHGDDPHKPGYTILELIGLLQSTFKPQVKLATRTLCNIVSRAILGPRCYFGYPATRWSNYIHNDVDLVCRMGFVCLENFGNVQIVADALRAMAILLFGDFSDLSGDGTNLLLTFNELLFGLLPNNLDVYSHNSMVFDFQGTDNLYDTLRGINATAGKHSSNEVLYQFFSDVLKGALVGMDADDINTRLPGEYDLHSLVYLLAHCGFISHLCMLLKRHMDNVALLSSICLVVSGILSRFGPPLARALCEYPEFTDVLGQLIHLQIYGTRLNLDYQSSVDISSGACLNLACSTLCFLRLLSGMYPPCFQDVLDPMGSVALVKQTLSIAFRSDIDSVYNLMDKRDGTMYATSKPAAICGIMALRCLSTWCAVGVHYDTLDELASAFQYEVYSLRAISSTETRVNGITDSTPNDKLLEFLGTTGLNMAHVCLHLELLLESDFGNHILYWWDSAHLRDLILDLCTLENPSYYPWSSVIMLFALRLYCAYCHHGTNVTLDNTLLGSIEGFFLRHLSKDGTMSLPRAWDSMELVVPLYCHNPQSGNIHRIVSFSSAIEAVSRVATPALLLESWLELHSLHKVPVPSGTLVQCKHLVDMMCSIIVEYQESISTDSMVLSKPVPMMHPWASFICTYVQLVLDSGTPKENGNLMELLLSALTISSCYSTTESLLQLLYGICELGGNTTIQDSANGYLEDMHYYLTFNRKLISCSLGHGNMPTLNFAAFIPVLSMGIISNSIDNFKVTGLMSSLLSRDAFRGTLLKRVPYVSVPELFLGLVASRVADTNWNLEEYSLSLLETLVFKDLESRMPLPSDRVVEPNKVTDYLRKHQSTGNYKKLMSQEALMRTASSILRQFKHGHGDSLFVVAALMLLISVYSYEECARMLWCDTELMCLVGRNVSVELDTLELRCAHPDGCISLGTVFMYLPEFNSTGQIRNAQSRLMREFGMSSDTDPATSNAIAFLCLVNQE